MVAVDRAADLDRAAAVDHVDRAANEDALTVGSAAVDRASAVNHMYSAADEYEHADMTAKQTTADQVIGRGLGKAREHNGA